jgi:glycosyltransferase involved in cell wall biosynthesis
VIPRRWRWDLSPVNGLVGILRERRFDVLHTFMFLPNFYGRLAGRRCRPGVLISSLRSTGVPGWHRYVAEVLMAPLCDLVISNSASGMDHLIRYGVNPSKVTVVRNGLDLSPYAPLAGRRRGRARGAGATLGMVARMERDKDHLGLLQALPRIAARHPGTRLILAGDGSLRPRVEKAISALGLGDRVELRGSLARPADAYADIDLYVQPSTVPEGVSNSIIEAMASGLPVVATAAGGNREVVVDGETGLLVPCHDPDALAAAVIALLDDPEKAALFGRRSAARARAQFSREVMIDATVSIYESFLARKSRPGDAAAASR